PSGHSLAVYWACAGTASIDTAAAASRCIFMTNLPNDNRAPLATRWRRRAEFVKGAQAIAMRLFHERKIAAPILMLGGDPLADFRPLVVGHRGLIAERHRLVLHRLRQDQRRVFSDL